MAEDFFEVLRDRAHNKFKGDPLPPHSDGYLEGVGATIEALREMAVGGKILTGKFTDVITTTTYFCPVEDDEVVAVGVFSLQDSEGRIEKEEQ